MKKIKVGGKMKFNPEIDLDFEWVDGKITDPISAAILRVEANLIREETDGMILGTPTGPLHKYPWIQDPEAFLAFLYAVMTDLEIETSGIEFPDEETDGEGHPLVY